MSSLIDRYVAAAADDFPGSDNTTITREVRAAVEDMVEAKLAEGLSQEDAERTAVEELGDPRSFAEQFRQEPRYLIGPRVFRHWWKTLRLVMVIVVPILIVLGVVDSLTSDGDAADMIGEIFGAAANGFLQVAFWVTLVFAIIEFTGRTSDLEDATPWTADSLPEVQTGRQITIGEVVGNLVALIGAIWLAVRLRTDQLGAFGLNKIYDLDPSTPLFNPELSQWWAIVFFALLVISLAVSVVIFIRGYWTRSALTIKLIDGGLWIAFVLMLGNAGDIINPVVTANSGDAGDWWITGENSNDIIIGIILIIVVWDMVESVMGHLKYRNLVVQSNS